MFKLVCLEFRSSKNKQRSKNKDNNYGNVLPHIYKIRRVLLELFLPCIHELKVTKINELCEKVEIQVHLKNKMQKKINAVNVMK
jgi:hypothetical protein